VPVVHFIARKYTSEKKEGKKKKEKKKKPHRRTDSTRYLKLIPERLVQKKKHKSWQERRKKEKEKQTNTIIVNAMNKCQSTGLHQPLHPHSGKKLRSTTDAWRARGYTTGKKGEQKTQKNQSRRIGGSFRLFGERTSSPELI